MLTTSQTFDAVRSVVAKSIGIENRIETLTPGSSLAGLAEFDSMAILDLMLAIEKHFGVTIEDEEITGDLFETIGTLAAFVETKLK